MGKMLGHSRRVIQSVRRNWEFIEGKAVLGLERAWRAGGSSCLPSLLSVLVLWDLGSRGSGKG